MGRASLRFLDAAVLESTASTPVGGVVSASFSWWSYPVAINASRPYSFRITSSVANKEVFSADHKPNVTAGLWDVTFYMWVNNGSDDQASFTYVTYSPGDHLGLVGELLADH